MAGTVHNISLRTLVCFALTVFMTGCAGRKLPVASKTSPFATSPDFIDLQAGWRLRVVTPILKSGGYVLSNQELNGSAPNDAERRVNGNTVEIAAGSDFLGYELAYYAVERRGRGVGIVLASAEINRDGQRTSQSSSIAPLFALPPAARYVRLIFLLRISNADHDMAVVAANRPDRLDEFTHQVQANPSEACKSEERRYCSWIPNGISVNPERPRMVSGATEWVPASASPSR
jgi:hypothetical protein